MDGMTFEDLVEGFGLGTVIEAGTLRQGRQGKFWGLIMLLVM